MISEVFNEDNMIGMARYPDGFFDLAIVDPPYGSNIMAKNKYQRHKTTATNYRNKQIPPKEYYIELYRVSRHQIIFGAQYQMKFLNPEGSFIVWDKKADPDLLNMSSCDIAWYSKRERVRTFRGHWCGAVKFENEPTIHIHQKPVALYKWMLSKYASPGMKILDTHMGSQSSRIAAWDMGFDYWGWELDPDYFRDGNKRFEQFRSQQKLFT